MHPATAKKASGRLKETPARPAAGASTGKCRCPERRFSRVNDDANCALRTPRPPTAPPRLALLQALLTSRDLRQPMAQDYWFITEAVRERALRVLLAEVDVGRFGVPGASIGAYTRIGGPAGPPGRVESR
jgi:hypothetical protein